MAVKLLDIDEKEEQQEWKKKKKKTTTSMDEWIGNTINQSINQSNHNRVWIGNCCLCVPT
jgi:hypothetical protein